jgi:hypothetical protein
MEEFENIYDKIKEIIGDYPNRLNVLEEQVDIDIQLEYFEFSRIAKEKLDKDAVMNESGKLLDPEISIEDKRQLLPKIASVETVEAFRTLEKFMKDPPGELKSWGILAMLESKMLLESKLLNENKVFISTGLGGKGNKLRYFVVLLGRDIKEFSELQKKVIRTEFGMTLKKYDGFIEKISFSQSFATLLTIIPMNVIIKKVFREAIDECNLYGEFLCLNFIITNVKILSLVEIRDFILRQNQKN